MSDYSTPLLLLFFAGVLLLVLASWLGFLKAVFKQQATVRNRLFAVDAGSLEWIEQARLRDLTADLEQQGFVQVLDVSAKQVKMDTPPPPIAASAFDQTTHQPYQPIPAPGAPPRPVPIVLPGDELPLQDVRAFARIFVHPQHGCAANILAARAEVQGPGGTVVQSKPLQVALITLWGAGDNFWVYATTNHQADPFAEWHRHPHSLLQRRVGAEASELLDLHLKTVPVLDRKIPQRLYPMRSAQDYLLYEELATRAMRAIYARKSVWQATLQYITFPFRQHDHYWGELEGQIQW